jgi:hypothetical protein
VRKRRPFCFTRYAIAKRHALQVNKYTFHLNDGNLERHTLEPLMSLMAASFDPHITGKELPV